MSCPAPALPALAALLASGGAALIPNGGIAPPETPKESKGWQPHQDRAGKGDVLVGAVADSVPMAEDRSNNDAVGGPPPCTLYMQGERAEAASPSEKKPLLPPPQEIPRNASAEAERASPKEEEPAQQHQQPQQEQAQVLQMANTSPEVLASPSAETPPSAPVPSVGPDASSLAAPAGPPPPSCTPPPRRGSDRSGEWHPLDAVVERIESHVRPGAGGQRLQWTKGFRMPLGAEGRQILLRRLRKAYHSNPMRWDEELARHRIVFSRMPYATVIELFHLAHLLGVFDFAVKCSEEYGSDAAGGATHRKRRPARTAAATAAAAAAQQAAAAEGGCAQAGAGAAGPEGGTAVSRPTQGERKRNRRTPAFQEGQEAPQLHSARPKRARRFSPAYLRDYETLAESFRLPPPPAKKGRSIGGNATGGAASAHELLSWSGSGSVDVPQLQPQDDLLAAALGGRECASAHEALLRAVEEQAAAAKAAATAGGGAASSYSSHPVESLKQAEFNDKIWGWAGEQSEPAEVAGSPLALPEGTLGGSGLTAHLESSLEGELRNLAALLQKEQQCKKQPEMGGISGSTGRVFFSAELPGGVNEEDEAKHEAAREERLRCSNNTGRSGANTVPPTQHRRSRKTKAAIPSSDGMNLSLSTGAVSRQPSLAELLVGDDVKREGNAAGAPATAAGESSGSQGVNLHLLTTNYTIAAQYLQVIELLAVQRQIMELTQNLNRKRPGEAAPTTAADTSATSEGILAAAAASPSPHSPKLDYQTLLNQQLILRLGAEAGLNMSAQQHQTQQGPSATSTHALILKDLEKKVLALECLAAERSVTGAHADGTAKNQMRAALPPLESKCRRDLSRQSALSCSAPDSPVDGYDSAAASPCCSGSSSSSACNTPDSLGGDRLLLLSSLWQPLPPAEGLAGAHA